MERRMLDYLPAHLQDIREFAVVLDACEQPEFEDLWLDAARVSNNQFVLDMDGYGVKRYEKMLEILPKASDSLTERKFRILTRLNEKLPYTITVLRSILASLCGEDGYTAVLLHREYRIVVRVALEMRSAYDSVESLLFRLMPANMVIDLSLMYNQHKTLAPHTHKALRQFTHYELRNEVLRFGN